MNTGYAPVNGLRLYYEIHGEGDVPLVLIHGGGSTIPSTFGVLLPLLSAKRKVIAVELQAHGRTSDRDAPETFEQDADDIAALLRYLQIDKADICGFSNGGTTTLHFAVRHADLARRIVVISAGYKRDGMIPGFFDGFPNATLRDMPEPLKATYLRVNPDPEGLQNMFDKDVARMLSFKDMADDDLRAIQIPALLIGGSRDVVLPEHILKMSRLMPRAEAVILPGTHGAAIGEVGSAQKSRTLPCIGAALIEGFLRV